MNQQQRMAHGNTLVAVIVNKVPPMLVVVEKFHQPVDAHMDTGLISVCMVSFERNLVAVIGILLLHSLRLFVLMGIDRYPVEKNGNQKFKNKMI